MMKFFVIVLAIYTSYNIVCAMLPKPRIKRDKIIAITVLDRDVPDNEIVEAFRKKLYDAIESVKWNAKFKLWADLGIQALSYPISKLNEMASLVGQHPNYDMWLSQLRQKALEKGQKTFTAGLNKLANALNDLHAHIKLYIDKMLKKKLTFHGTQNEDLLYMDYNDYIKV